MALLSVLLLDKSVFGRLTRKIVHHNIVTCVVFALCKHKIARVVSPVTSHSYVLRRRGNVNYSFIFYRCYLDKDKSRSKKRVLKSPDFLAERSSRKTVLPLFRNCIQFERVRRVNLDFRFEFHITK
jgi:hypothetical protein